MKKILQILVLVLIATTATAQMPVYAPTHTAPIDASIDRTPNVLLDWYPVAGATKYIVEIDTNAAFTNATTLNSLYTAVKTSNLLFNGNYHWRVAAIGNANDTSAWSTAWTFSVVENVTLTGPISLIIDTVITPGPPIDTTITITSFLHSPDVLLDWTGISGVNAYQVQIDDDLLFSSILFDSIVDTPATSKNAYHLAYGDSFYWRVRMMHSLDTSSWSETWIVHIKDTLILMSPADSSEKRTPVSLLKFEGISGSDYFEYQYDTNTGFTTATTINVNYSYLLFVTYPVDTVVEVLSDTLMFGTTYYWRARAAHAVNNSAWSNYWMFTTIDTVNLVSPADAATQINRKPTLTWDSIAGAISYDVMYDTLSNFSTATTANVSNYSMFISTEFDKNQTVYWKVRANSSVDVSEWSEAFSFTTVDGVGIEDMAVSNLSVYPNPTKDIIQININANSVQNAQINVSNIIGQNVYTKNTLLTSGANNLYIDLSAYNNGIYIVKVVTKNNSLSKKVILNK